MERRFGGDAAIVYLDVDSEEVRSSHGSLVTDIETRGLLYPVTVISGAAVYDGAVSYPAILRAVTDHLAQAAS